MDDRKREYGDEEEVEESVGDEEGQATVKPCPRGVHGKHFFIAGRCVRCGEPEPLEH
jgi:hypothetical protein